MIINQTVVEFRIVAIFLNFFRYTSQVLVGIRCRLHFCNRYTLKKSRCLRTVFLDFDSLKINNRTVKHDFQFYQLKLKLYAKF